MIEPLRDKGRLEHPWTLIEKMRHILVHDYYRINNDILWLVITEDLPPLKSQVESYIHELEQLSHSQY